jgi:DNA-binding LacI/PurR family transcriptional regulator
MLAGVSQATVSHVLNDVGNSRFSDETRDRVLSAVDALGYVPHAMASALRAGQSNLILITFLSLPTGAQLAVFYDQLAAKLNERGYTVLFHADRAQLGVAAARSWAALRPAGVIVDGMRLSDDVLKVLRKVGVKAIVALGGDAIRSVPTVSMEGDVAGKLAAEHMISMGRHRLAVVVPKDPELLPVAMERLNAAEKVARERNIALQRIDLALDEEDAARMAAEWKRGPHPDGIFAFNDIYAGLLLIALQEAGLRVPDDIAVIGCDDLPVSRFFRPRLTTVRFPIEEITRQIATIVDAMVQGKSVDFERSHDAEAHLVLRDSA